MERKQPNFLGALAVIVVMTGVVVWWVSSLANDDLLWFLRAFNARADWIVIYWEGDTHMLFPGDPGYDEIMDAFADAAAHWTGYEGGVGLSDESLDRFRNEWRMLELHYNEPVHVHTRHLYPEARTFFIPLSGTHAKYHRIFAGLNDKPRIGVLNASEARFNRLLTAVEQAIHEMP